MRVCKYRNCKKDISNMRPNAKFSVRKCKAGERKYKSIEIKKGLK